MPQIRDLLVNSRPLGLHHFPAFSPKPKNLTNESNNCPPIIDSLVHLLIIFSSFVACIWFLVLARSPQQIVDEFGGLFVIGGIGIWRWSVLLINISRCFAYLTFFILALSIGRQLHLISIYILHWQLLCQPLKKSLVLQER